jgi:GAF domain-containing protein
MDGDSQRFVDTLRRFVATLVTSYDLTDVLGRLCHAVVENLPVSGAGVAVLDAAGDLRFAAATDDRIRHLETIQEQTRSGPCMTAFEKGRIIVVDDLETTEDWPLFRHAALAGGVRTVIAVPLQIEDQRVGTLDLYCAWPVRLTQLELGMAQTFADMATSFLLNVRQQHRSEEVAAQLQYALSHRVVVEQAKGIIAGRQGITVDDALDRLRRRARDSNQQLREVARQVVDGALDV